MQKIKLLILFAIGLCACSSNLPDRPATIVRCADMPSPRTSATAFATEDYGYVFGGRKSDDKNDLTNTLFRYDPTTDSWTELPPAPLRARVNGTACYVGGKVYIGLGFCGTIYKDQSYLRDWWEYDPITETWDTLPNYPSRNTLGVISYTDGNYIYCLYGMCEGFTTEIVRYDIAQRKWQMLTTATNLSISVMAAAGAQIGGDCYFGTGYHIDDQDTWYKVDFEGQWQSLNHVPGRGGRSMAVCTANNRYIYLSGGRHFGGSLTDGHVFNDILRYDPNTDEWTLAGTLPIGTENMVGMTLAGKAYLGLGEAEDGTILTTLYRIEE